MAYETFAFVYDEVMDKGLYKDWLEFSQRHLGGRREIMELACGTGALAVAFAQAGYHVTGLDLSEEMLMIASQRAVETDVSVQFVEGDMLDLSDVGTYQAVTCYSDSLCYMRDEEEVQQVFDGVYGMLEEEGIFIFDVHSLYQINKVFPEYSYHYQTDDFAFLWDSYPGEVENSIQHFLTFFVTEDVEDGLFTREDELHKERTYSLEVYQRMLENAGFAEIEVFGDFTDLAPKDDTKRWFFVCKKN